MRGPVRRRTGFELLDPRARRRNGLEIRHRLQLKFFRRKRQHADSLTLGQALKQEFIAVLKPDGIAKPNRSQLRKHNFLYRFREFQFLLNPVRDVANQQTGAGRYADGGAGLQNWREEESLKVRPKTTFANLRDFTAMANIGNRGQTHRSQLKPVDHEFLSSNGEAIRK